MADQAVETLSLFDDVSRARASYGAGPLEAMTTSEIEAMNAVDPFDSARRMTAQICLSLAQNIDAGNRKGRAIANEANQLALLLDQLRGDTTDTDLDESIPSDVRELFDLGSVPVPHDAAEVRDAPEP